MSAAHELPEGATRPTMTTAKFPFDPASSVWNLAAGSGPVTFDFRKKNGAAPDLRTAEKELMAMMIQKREPLRVLGHHEAFLKLVGIAGCRTGGEPVTEFVAADLRRIVAITPGGKEHQVANVRALMRAWADAGIPGLSADMREFAKSLKVVTPLAG